MAQQVEFKKVRDFGEVIGDTFLFIKQNFKPLLKTFVYFCGFFMLAGMISTIILQINTLVDSNAYVGTNNFQVNYFHQLGDHYIEFLFTMLIGMLFFNSLSVSVLGYIAAYIQKGNVVPTTTEVWGYYKYYFFRFFGISIVTSLFMGLCFVCCVIPGIYVFPAMTILYPVVIVENAGLGGAFDRSFKLIKNEWWITAAIILVVWIITYFASAIIRIPSVIIAMVSALTHAEKPIGNAYVIVSSIGQYLSYFFFLIPMIASALIYFNLVERKESVGLMSRIENLGADAAETHHPEEEY